MHISRSGVIPSGNDLLARKVTKLRFVLTLFLLAMLAAPFHPTLAQGRPATVVVDAVRTSEFSDTRPVIGRLVAAVRSQIASREAGVIEAVRFQVGDRVRRGHVMVQIDTTPAEIERRAAIAARAVAEAGVAVARAKLQLAQQTFERQSKLRNSTAFSRSRFDDLRQSMEQARSELAQAQAAVGQAKAQIAKADYTLKHAKIAAPFDGVVVSRMAHPGQYVQLGTVIATLVDTSGLEIDADVPTTLIAGLKPGKTVSAVFDSGRKVEAQVRAVIPVDNMSTRTRSVRFKVDLGVLDTASIAVGTAVTLSVPASAPRAVLTVAKDALVQARKGWLVYVAEDGKAVPRPVVLGQQVGERVEIVSGLAAGDLVVVRGNERLRPGQPLSPKQLGKRGTGNTSSSDRT